MGILKNKIDSKSAVISVIGMGYVGLPLAIEFARSGFKTFGLDVDSKKIKTLSEFKSYIKHISKNTIKEVVGTKLIPTVDFSCLKKSDCIIICVPTPLNVTKEPDLSFVIDTAEKIGKYLKKGQMIVLESTTFPGTTDNIVKPILEKKMLYVGKDIYLAFSPEREDPGNKNYSTRTIPKVVGGTNKESTELACLLYSKVIDKVVPVSSTKVAEATKMLENTFRAVNIALVNELKILFDKMGFDIWEVIEASKTKPFGFMPFYPGPGWGGHCIPIDPFYLSWIAKKYDASTKFIELAGEINTKMPEYVINKAQDALNENGKALKNAKVLILGLAYKNDSDDMRESPSLKLIELLKNKGARVSYNDPFIPKTPKTRHYSISMTSVPLTISNIRKFDCLIISTHHSCYDYKFIFKNAKLIVDTRNTIKMSSSKKLIKA
jgi:UDP-N-acetyl-D-glucosamine dehydrogenase